MRRRKRKEKEFVMHLATGLMLEVAKYYLGYSEHEILISAIKLNNEQEEKIKELEKLLEDKK